MTRITVSGSEKTGYVITVKGHAGYGTANRFPAGCDKVCAAVSALACTLIEVIRNLEDFGKLESVNIQCIPGDIEIHVKAQEKNKERLETVITTILTGFQMLTAEYPLYVSMENEGGGKENSDMVIYRKQTGKEII